MKPKPASIVPTKRRETMGDKVRKIANQLDEETKVQIKATSRILGAAAQIAENHDKLIDEVADMVEEDLARETQVTQTVSYTVDSLKQQYKTLQKAKTHFGLKVNSWAALVNKLNNKSLPIAQSNPPQSSVLERLAIIESEIKNIRADIAKILSLLTQLLLNKQ